MPDPDDGSVPAPPPARTALVTGAGRGIGRRLAEALAGAGLAVGVLGRSDQALRPVLDAVTAAGGRAVPVIADVRSWEQVRDAVAEAEQALGGIDLLVNNAGVIEPVEVAAWESDPQTWWDVVETDLRGPFHCVRAAVPGMLARGGGRVVDLSSGAAIDDRAVYSAYCAAKAGLLRLDGNLHEAGHRQGLRVFAISPGVQRTEMTASMAVHAGRTEWTDPADLDALVLAAAGGELDAWSGCFLRAGTDRVETLRQVAGRSPEGVGAGRRFAVRPYGADDPLA